MTGQSESEIDPGPRDTVQGKTGAIAFIGVLAAFLGRT